MQFIGKLGKAPARRDDRTLKLARYITPELPEPPVSCDWSGKARGIDMLGNDRFGDCVEAGALHLEQVWTANAEPAEIMPTTEDALAAYAAVTGFRPDDPSTDRGTNMLAFLNWWRQTGLSNPPRRLSAYAEVDPGDPRQVMLACWLFGGVYTGIALPRAIQYQEVWDVDFGPDGGYGSLGGHCVPIVAYDEAGLTCITWGALKRMTWAFFATYCDEAFALLPDPAEWRRADGSTPPGFDWANLVADLAGISAA